MYFVGRFFTLKGYADNLEAYLKKMNSLVLTEYAYDGILCEAKEI